MKQQILFVDDNTNALDGLRYMFRQSRDEWDIYYVQSGIDALGIMDSQHIDIIITDMRMPEMDGAALLRESMKRHPEAIRMILSGQADSSMPMQAVDVAHQFICKPYDPEILKLIITRAINLRALLKNERLKNIISEMDSLPTVPILYLEMAEELKSPEPSIQKVGQIIARDPGMTAKILQLANSAFFALRRRVSNPAEATSYLGLDRVQRLFLAVHAFSQFQVPTDSPFSIESLWEHSLSTAARAKAISTEEDAPKDTCEDAFAAGLLHDIGKLMLACKLPRSHSEAVHLARLENIPLWVAEKRVMSVTHAEIGAYLLGLWGLPDAIVEATAYHHRPEDCTNKSFCALTALHAADCEGANHSYPGIPAPQPNVEYLSRFIRN